MTSENTTHKNMANAIRALAMDAVQAANSGHPGAPMGMADMAVALWSKHLKHNPNNPHWLDRDRFVLSNGHGSMLIYALLHLSGYDLPMSELKNFRQLHSKTAGHPEYGITPGEICNHDVYDSNGNFLRYENRIGSRIYHDLQVGWKTPWNGKVIAGARNIFAKDPPITRNSFAGSFDGAYDLPEGGFWYLQYNQKF